MLAAGGSLWAATLLASALTALAVERATGYGAGTVDPVAALDLVKPLPNLADETCVRYVERFGVTSTPIRERRRRGATQVRAPEKPDRLLGPPRRASRSRRA
jgi:hypothetical protein